MPMLPRKPASSARWTASNFAGGRGAAVSSEGGMGRIVGAPCETGMLGFCVTFRHVFGRKRKFERHRRRGTGWVGVAGASRRRGGFRGADPTHRADGARGGVR